MKPEQIDKKKAWSLSLNAAQIGELEDLISRLGGTDRTEFTLKALSFYAGLQPGNPDLLVNLAAVYHPTLRTELAAVVGEYIEANPEANPAKMIAYFLDELVTAMRANRDLGEPFRLVSASQQKEWEGTRGRYESLPPRRGAL